MNDFQFISANETYRNLYYQLPKVLFTSEFYKTMSNDSKIAYAMLQDRCEYSIQNNWIDQDGHIYFIFTRNELMDILGCKENKIAKIKKELKDKIYFTKNGFLQKNFLLVNLKTIRIVCT